MIKQRFGKAIIKNYEAPASVAFDFNDVVTRNSSGQLAKATNTTPRSEILGLIQQTIASTDDDYASSKTVAVLIPHKDAIFEADVDSGTLTSSMVGLDFDLNDEDGIDVTANVQRAVKIDKFINSSKALVSFNTDGNKMRLVKYQETVEVADFTDGGGADGTISLGVSIPAGAVFAQTLISDIVGFAGDTTATAKIGDGSDADRYSTGTPSVFTTAPAGADAGVPSGTKFHSTAKTPVVTVTGGSDFTSIADDGNGKMTITLFWYEAS